MKQYLYRIPGVPKYWNNKIYDGDLEVGRFEMGEKGSYATTYKIINSKGNHVANFTIIPSESKANVYSIIDNDEYRRWFFYKSNNMNPPTAVELSDDLMQQCAKYVVDVGFL